MDESLFAVRLRMVEAMKRKAYTMDQLAALTGQSKSAVERWHRSERKNMHVEGYADDARGRKFVPMWRWGPGENAPRPGPRCTPAERMRLVRLRRANPDLF